MQKKKKRDQAVHSDSETPGSEEKSVPDEEQVRQASSGWKRHQTDGWNWFYQSTFIAETIMTILIMTLIYCQLIDFSCIDFL